MPEALWRKAIGEGWFWLFLAMAATVSLFGMLYAICSSISRYREFRSNGFSVLMSLIFAFGDVESKKSPDSMNQDFRELRKSGKSLSASAKDSVELNVGKTYKK
ncbi:MAG TPA: hypothetical protein VN867_11715 [Candidatus Binataceae bacterium]|nr:hypothetical protein [Candidatus Binataceae bacterium]